MLLRMQEVLVVAFFAAFPSTAVATPSNLAENQPTWQSSINHGGYSSRAVDGGLSPNWIDGSCIHTGYGPAIWAVDLSWIADVYYVKVLIRAGNPGDGHFYYMKDFLVTVTNTRFPVSYDQLSSSFTRCGQYSGNPPAGQWGRVTCSPDPVRGRYVYVSIDVSTHCLSMCEVQVIGVPVWNSLGYIKSKPTDCGHEYQIGTVWPATWSYNISSIGDPNYLECFTHCNRLPSCTGFKSSGNCEILLEP